MTFIASTQPVDFPGASLFLGRRTVKGKGRARGADEDVARRALGPDGRMPVAATPGIAIEHLARIALG